jgi:hypothetical protein
MNQYDIIKNPEKVINISPQVKDIVHKMLTELIYIRQMVGDFIQKETDNESITEGFRNHIDRQCDQLENLHDFIDEREIKLEQGLTRDYRLFNDLFL